MVAEVIGRSGATILGRRMFDNGEEPWGPEPPFRQPVFVVTHRAREPLVKKGGTTFHFVTDGIESALGQARAAAGDKDVQISGGADLVQQYLIAGLLDEVEVHLAPVFLGGGVRLFDRPELTGVRLEAQPGRPVAGRDPRALRRRAVAPASIRPVTTRLRRATGADISAAQARRIALGAQGFGDRRPPGRIDRRHVRRVLDRVGLIQIDSVNVLVRSQEMPLFARLGPHPRDLLPRMAADAELVEYWCHEASLLPVDLWPLMRWRMTPTRGGLGRHASRSAATSRATCGRCSRRCASGGR